MCISANSTSIAFIF